MSRLTTSRTSHTPPSWTSTSGFGEKAVHEDSLGTRPTTEPAKAPACAAQPYTMPHDVVWSLEDGDWTVVGMNADGSADVAVDLSVGAKFPAISWVIAILLSLGGFLLILATLLIAGALRAGRNQGLRP
jgi:hypothetical protein